MDNNKKLYEYRDSSGVEHSINISNENFKLAQADKAIHDQKFKTKPTTFFKDALKRFRKNKSSVFGAVILGGLLVLSVVVPIFDTSDLNTPKPLESFLEPKLFNAGTGFWDGTKRLTNIPCDPTNEVDVNGVIKYYPNLESYPVRAISQLSTPRIGLINSATKFAKGGFVQLINNENIATNNPESVKAHTDYYVSSAYDFDFNKNYDLTIAFYEQRLEDYTLADYTVNLSYDLEETKLNENNEEETILTSDNLLPLKLVNDITNMTTESLVHPIEGNKPYQLNVLNIKDVLSRFDTLNLTKNQKVKNIRVSIGVLPTPNSHSSICINNVKLTSNDDESLAKKDPISFIDANENLNRTENKWTFTGTTSLLDGEAYVCDFVFDTYEAAYGVQNKTVLDVNIKEYVEKGYLNLNIDPNATDEAKQAIYDEFFLNLYIENASGNADAFFKQHIKDDSLLPIIKILDVTKETSLDSNTGFEIVSYKFDCEVSGYKLYGYKTMPRFLVGTDDKGYNLLKQVFVGLRNSLGLGLMTFGICFTFGLIFGAICGYFGGTIDIALQRLVDILSGVPWIVIMTLTVLHLGSNFWTFVLAMCLTGWIGTSSLTRTQFYRFRDREYTLASRTLGASNPRLIFRHILPNAMGTIITSSVLMIPSVIFSEATISYLGLGFQDMTSLGVTLSNNQTFLLTYPHLILFPSAIMALIMISFNLFGNGLRDAFNPSLKGSE